MGEVSPELREEIEREVRVAVDEGAKIGRDAYRRTMIEECAAGAVVGTLRAHLRGPSFAHDLDKRPDNHPIPIAAAPPSLAEAVARLLVAKPPCFVEECREGDECVRPGEECETCPQYPFAGAYSDANGRRTYTLVSRECETCDGIGGCPDPDGLPKPLRCISCNGTGSTTDVGAIARRYGGDGDARVARFEVQL